jgi:integrase
MARNNYYGTTTAAIWKTIFREWRTTFAPILINFSRNVVDVQGGERRLVPELIEVSDLSRLIFEVLSLRETVMIFLGFGTGLRRAELGGIKWEDIDFETGQLHPRRSSCDSTSVKPKRKPRVT